MVVSSLLRELLASKHRRTPGQEGLPKAPRASLPWRPPRRPCSAPPPAPTRARGTATPTPHSHLPPCQMGTLEVVTPTFVLRAPGRQRDRGLVPRDTPTDTAVVWRTVHPWTRGHVVSEGDPQAACGGELGGAGTGRRPGAGSRAAATPSRVCGGRCTPWASLPALGPRSGVTAPPQLVGASLRSQSWSPLTGARPTGPAAPWAGLSDHLGLSHPLTWGRGESSPEPRRPPRPGATWEDRGWRSEWRWGQSLGPHPGGQRLPAKWTGPEPEPKLCGRFCDDVAWMTGRRPGFYWRATWKVVSPLLLLTIFVAYIALLASSPPHYKAWNPRYVSPLGRGMTLEPKTQPDPPPVPTRDICAPGPTWAAFSLRCQVPGP